MRSTPYANIQARVDSSYTSVQRGLLWPGFRGIILKRVCAGTSITSVPSGGNNERGGALPGSNLKVRPYNL